MEQEPTLKPTIQPPQPQEGEDSFVRIYLRARPMSKRELNSNDENLEPSYSLNSEKNTILFEDENWEAAKSYSVNGIFQNPVDATQAGYDGRNM
jgi:hypothetical protein